MSRLEWFGGNEDAVTMCKNLEFLSHVWDDIVDNDKEIKEHDINAAFMTALVHLPLNRFYQSIFPAIAPMWEMVVLAYETANTFERTKDAHGLEIAHALRYAAGHIIAFSIVRCVGYDKAREYLPLMWKEVVHERFDDYRQEHEAS